MGLKKYEIITVGSDKRVRALRSWQVGDRYVNIGDVGGIVYDEKTLSQDGACWLFRGNFGFPGARIGGDSIVDVGEAALSATGAPSVDILGSSVVVGSKLQFASEQTEADAVVLTAADFEQGFFRDLLPGAPLTPDSSVVYIRLKKSVFSGGKPVTLKCDVPGYAITAIAVDRDNTVITNAPTTQSGPGVVITVPAGQYFNLYMTKDTITVPADATAAQLTFTGTYETKLSIIDSRVEINPATSAGTTIIRPGGTYTIASGAKYPEAIIRNSKVSMSVPAVAGRSYRIMGQIIESNATLDATAGDVSVAGQYSNIKNLTASGTITSNLGVTSYNVIQATNCNDFAVSPTIFPGLAAAQAAKMPFIFQGCNVPDGRFYHHAQIANTYRDINFDLATADLGKATAKVNVVLVSSDVEGMYRVYHKVTNLWGPLVESLDSVVSIKFLGGDPSKGYATTIYKDAYFNGEFDFAGTNVFGNKVRSHPLAQVLNVAPRAVQGNFNTTTVGQTITGVIPSDIRVCIPTPFRINGANGLKIEGMSATLEALVIFVTPSNVVTAVASSSNGVLPFPAAQLNAYAAYVRFGKNGGTAITTEDLTGVTVTVYNGCKIVNTGAAAVNMKGNIRVEDNATLLNSSITGTGYFGGNAVASGLIVNGCAYMRDNASFTKTAGSTTIRDLKMTENAYAVMGDFSLNGRIHLSDNARFIPRSAELFEGDLIMKDNAVVSGNAAVIIGGAITMKDNARVSGGTVALSAYGDITLCGSYNQTVNKTWTGKRVIDSQNAPTYDDNVKTKYDF